MSNAVTVHSFALSGVSARPATITVMLVRRLPRTTIVGLPADTVRETADRVRSAITASGFDYPRERVVVNIDTEARAASGMDLPIALGILVASGQLDAQVLEGKAFAGELSLNGVLRQIGGGVAMASQAEAEGKVMVLPYPNASIAAQLRIHVWGCSNLQDAVEVLEGNLEGNMTPDASEMAPEPLQPKDGLCLSDIRGQAMTKRAMEIAAVGGHSLLLVGCPGYGATMAAARLTGILPAMTHQERVETAAVHDAAGLTSEHPAAVRPFRAPHYSISGAGLLGNARLRPGEVTLAHRGVLFLDEVSEFTRANLEQLQTVLVAGEVVLVRSGGTTTMPAQVQVVGSVAPCPCGYLGHQARTCSCPEAAVERHQRRAFGSNLFAMRVDLEHVDLGIRLSPRGETSAAVRARVTAARVRSASRDGAPLKACDAAQAMLADAAKAKALSPRAQSQIIAVATSIADLDGSDTIDIPHLAEALAFAI